MRIQRRTFGKLAAGAAAGFAAPAIAQNKPLTIGFSMALTGAARAQRQGGAAGVADLGRGHQRQGRPARPAGEAGLLRRPVNPSTVPGIYTKLLDVDKVDIIVGATPPT